MFNASELHTHIELYTRKGLVTKNPNKKKGVAKFSLPHKWHLHPNLDSRKWSRSSG